MSIYVDDMNARYHGVIMCHMIADSTDELLEMARKIGVRQRWAQHMGSHKEHFDICLAKKKQAIQNGAIEITQRELAQKIDARRRSMNPQLVEKGGAK